jgi:hypothetical protein
MTISSRIRRVRLPKFKVILIAAVITAGPALGLTAAAAPSALGSPAAPHSAVVFQANKIPAVGSTITVCLHNSRLTGWCADVYNNHNTAGTRIWLWHNGSDDKWVVAATQCALTGMICFALEDAQSRGLCLTATGTGGAPIELERCNDRGTWYNQGGNELGNGFYGAAGDLDAQAAGQGQYLYAYRNGNYLTWNAPGIN